MPVKYLLDNINLEIKKGDFFALLGPNGAGKSTAIGIMTTLVTKTSGSVQIFSYDLDKNPNQLKSVLAWFPKSLISIFLKLAIIFVGNRQAFTD